MENNITADESDYAAQRAADWMQHSEDREWIKLKKQMLLTLNHIEDPKSLVTILFTAEKCFRMGFKRGNIAMMDAFEYEANKAKNINN